MRNTEKQDFKLEKVLDFTILRDADRAITHRQKVFLNYKISNINRSVGALLSNEISKKYGYVGLPKNTITLSFRGSAGQSLGVFGASGITFIVEGNTNDYLGKGLSGAKIIVKTSKESDFKAHENIIAGNVMFIWSGQRRGVY